MKDDSRMVISLYCGAMTVMTIQYDFYCIYTRPIHDVTNGKIVKVNDGGARAAPHGTNVRVASWP